MKELDVFRYLKKYRRVIVVVSILAGIAFYMIAQYYIQQYTAVPRQRKGSLRTIPRWTRLRYMEPT